MKEIKLKKCKVCTQKFVLERFNQQTCDYKCAIQLSKDKQKEKEAKEWKAEKAILRDNLKTLGQYEADAKKSFQKWVRMRDDKHPCISCGTIKADTYDGGHYFKAELFSGLIFDERNCHKQCRKCNRFLNGNELQYRQGLISRYGIEFVDQLESESNEKRNHKFTKDELIAKKMQYDIKIKEINKLSL
jgi:hypothetical protein